VLFGVLVLALVDVSPTFGSDADSGLTRFSSSRPELPTFSSRRPSPSFLVGAPVSGGAVLDPTPDVVPVVVVPVVVPVVVASALFSSNPVVPLTPLAFSSRLSVPVAGSLLLKVNGLDSVEATSDGSDFCLSAVVRRFVGVSRDFSSSDSGRRTAALEGSVEVESRVAGFGLDVRVDLEGRDVSSVGGKGVSYTLFNHVFGFSGYLGVQHQGGISGKSCPSKQK